MLDLYELFIEEERNQDFFEKTDWEDWSQSDNRERFLDIKEALKHDYY